MELENCRNCKKLFQNYTKGNKICPVCKAIEDRQFEIIRKYLEEFPLSTLLQVSEGTDILPKIIVKFIRLGRLVVVENSPIQIECLKCGQPIRYGKYCVKCTREFRKGLKEIQVNKDKDVELELSENKAEMHYTRRRKIHY